MPDAHVKLTEMIKEARQSLRHAVEINSSSSKAELQEVLACYRAALKQVEAKERKKALMRSFTRSSKEGSLAQAFAVEEWWLSLTWLWMLALAPGLLLGAATWAYLPSSYERCNAMAWGTLGAVGTLALPALLGAFGEHTFMATSIFGLLFSFAFVLMCSEMSYAHRKETEDKRILRSHAQAVEGLLCDWPTAVEVKVDSPWGDRERVADLWRKLDAQLQARDEHP